MTTVESRVGALEGRADEQAAAIAALREDIRDLRTELRESLAAVRGEISDVRTGLAAVNARIDRLYIAMLTVGVGTAVAQVGVIVTIVLRT